MPALRRLRPVEDQKELLSEGLRKKWADLLAARRTARNDGDAKEAERLFQYGLGFLSALFMTNQISHMARDDLREALINS